jgi:hypothetical protein
MIPSTLENLLIRDTSEAVEKLLDDHDVIFWVDWREEDDAIVGYCEDILQTGTLAVEVEEIDDDPGFEMYLSYGDRREKVPLVGGDEDRHITIYALNQILKPDYEIRVCTDSKGMDTLAFLPLSVADWAELETRFGDRVHRRFRKIEERPNLFTEAW